jgi:hypothetical protein
MTFTAFIGTDKVACGAVESVLREVKRRAAEGGGALVFEDATGKQVDFDWEGTADEVVRKLAAHPVFRDREPLMTARSGPGRPRLGVVGREVSLLPRHWEWLEAQPQGASAAIRRLVDEARKREPGKDAARRARTAAGTFLWAMAGNLPDFEEASRALYADDRAKFRSLTVAWPQDVRAYALALWEAGDGETEPWPTGL